MNKQNFDNDANISKIGKTAFLMLIIIAIILFAHNYFSIIGIVLILIYFLIAYGKELILPILNNELRLQMQVGKLGIDFIKVFIILLKEKGSFTNKDLEIITEYFAKEYDEKSAKEVSIFIKKNFYTHFNITDITHNLSKSLRLKEKYQFIDQLFRFCIYTGKITANQKKTIYNTAKQIRLTAVLYHNIVSKYAQKTKDEEKNKQQHKQEKSNHKHQYQRNKNYSSAYLEIGVQPTISNSDLKKTYRSLAKKYHPDKWAHRTLAERKKAKEKFQKINNAYALIKKSRNLS